ncbi:MAG: TonB family protein [Deltaproteobacteria bacterium]|nr:TonB family protein [Deltaproteobacteria bacterium]
MLRSRQEIGDAAWAGVLSLGFHVALSLFCASFVRLPEPPQSAVVRPASLELPEPAIDVGLELPALAASSGLSQPASEPLPAELRRGGDVLPRPDTKRAGRGGSDEVDAPAVNLAPRDDEAHLVPAIRSRIDRAQQARTKTGTSRRSPEDDRVSPAPMVLTFVADGRGARLEQRPAAPRDPSGGGWRAAVPAQAAPAHAHSPTPWGERTAEPVGETAQLAPRDGVAPRSSTGSGVIDRSPGLDSRASADVATAQPQTIRGRESSPSNRRGSQQDDVDSEQEVVNREPSLLRASTAGGKPGTGPGGQGGGSRPGAGGDSGPGSTARALGSGAGRGTGIDPADARRRRYLRALWSRIHGSWSGADFPRWAVFEGRQGYTIVSFVVLRDGNVASVRVSRPSGIAEFDARMVQAVQRAAPFGVLPDDLGPAYAHSHEFVVTNPAVRPPRP